MSGHAKVDVVFIDDDILVVDKPAGVHCHPLRDDESDTLLDRVAATHPEVRAPTFPARDGSLLHRLDVGTSGLVAFARHARAFALWRARFSHDLDDGSLRAPIEKLYVAIVDGCVGDVLTLERPIAHHAKSKARMVVVHERTPHRGHARAASTVVVPLAHTESASLVAISLHGGRRHQIRVHPADADRALCGDVLYGGTSRDDGEGPLLHAALLALDDTRVVSADPPAAFLAALTARGLKAPADWKRALARAFDRA
jgi:23S rRNA pseudouridine1911/1915/1917 synthase